MMTRPRKPIKLRNHITEQWNAGHSLFDIAYASGLSVERVQALLKAAKAGYHTPAQQQEAEAPK